MGGRGPETPSMRGASYCFNDRKTFNYICPIKVFPTLKSKCLKETFLVTSTSVLFKDRWTFSKLWLIFQHKSARAQGLLFYHMDLVTHTNSQYYCVFLILISEHSFYKILLKNHYRRPVQLQASLAVFLIIFLSHCDKDVTTRQE